MTATPPPQPPDDSIKALAAFLGYASDVERLGLGRIDTCEACLLIALDHFDSRGFKTKIIKASHSLGKPIDLVVPPARVAEKANIRLSAHFALEVDTSDGIYYSDYIVNPHGLLTADVWKLRMGGCDTFTDVTESMQDELVTERERLLRCRPKPHHSDTREHLLVQRDPE